MSYDKSWPSLADNLPSSPCCTVSIMDGGKEYHERCYFRMTRPSRRVRAPYDHALAWSKACPMTNRLGIGFSVYRCLAAGVGQRTTACRRCSVLRTRPNLSYSPPLESIAGTARSVGLPSPPTRPRSYCTVTPLPRIGRIAKGKDSGLKFSHNFMIDLRNLRFPAVGRGTRTRCTERGTLLPVPRERWPLTTS